GDREILGWYMLRRSGKMILVIGLNGVVVCKEVLVASKNESWYDLLGDSMSHGETRGKKSVRSYSDLRGNDPRHDSWGEETSLGVLITSSNRYVKTPGDEGHDKSSSEVTTHQ
ncbi:hypothetical protein HAX54_022184, partial [Datura stramonium]|nr:hypothetical protein [Datura stramonium]